MKRTTSGNQAKSMGSSQKQGEQRNIKKEDMFLFRKSRAEYREGRVVSIPQSPMKILG